MQGILQGFLCGPDFIQCVQEITDPGLQSPQYKGEVLSYPGMNLADFGGAGTEHLYDKFPEDALVPGGLLLELDAERKTGQLRVSRLDFHASDVSGFLGSVKPGDYVRVFSRYDSSVFAILKVVGASQQGKEHVFDVEVLAVNSYFLDGDRVALTLSPAGPAGPTVSDADAKGPSLNAAKATIFSQLNSGITSSDARVFEVLPVVVTESPQRIPIPESLQQVCVPGSILPVGHAPAKPVAVGLRVEEGELVIEVDPAQLDYYKQIPVVVQLSGLALPQ